jgi:hypothetical protein
VGSMGKWVLDLWKIEHISCKENHVGLFAFELWFQCMFPIDQRVSRTVGRSLTGRGFARGSVLLPSG